MSIEIMNPLAGAGWPTGSVTNIQEPISAADGDVVSTTIADDQLTTSLSDVAVVTDVDTVNSITVKVRARATDISVATASIDIQLIDSGTPLGWATGDDLTETFATYEYTDAGWDADWTEAELNGMGLQITARQGGAGSPSWIIDSIDVEIDYGAVPDTTIEAGVGALALTGKVPVADTTNSANLVAPIVGAAVLAGQATTMLISDTITVGAAALAFIPKEAFVNPSTIQLQVSGWNSGWPTGSWTNIDEPTSSPDAQTISTTILSDAVRIYFDDLTGQVDALTDVLDITFVVRCHQDYTADDPPDPAAPPELGLGVYIDAVSLEGGTPVAPVSLTTATNVELSHDDWEGPWTVAQIDTLEVRISASYLMKSADADTMYIDGIDCIIHLQPPSPVSIQALVGALAISTDAPTLFTQHVVSPAIATLAVTGKSVTLDRADDFATDADALFLTPKLPTRVVNFITSPLVGAVALAGQAPVRVMTHLPAPAVDALVLAGQVPTVIAPDARSFTPGNCFRFLATEAPLVITGTGKVFGPAVDMLVLAGQAPTVVHSLNVWEDPTTDTAVLAGKVPVVAISHIRDVAAGALVLAGQSVVDSTGRFISVSEVDLAFSMATPITGGLAGSIALAGKTPTILVSDFIIPAAATLTLAGVAGVAPNNLAPIVSNEPIVVEATLALDGKIPVIEVTSGITPGHAGTVFISIDYDIEFIATPTDTV
jgi:hypothetical protein